MGLALFFILATSPGHAVSAGVVQVVPVQATILNETVIVGEAVTSEGETRNVSAFPENPESYLPMPIPQTPENVGEIVVAPDENKLVDDVAESHAPIQIVGKRNSAVLVSEEDWRAIQETLFLTSIPEMRESIREGLKTPVEACDEELDW